MTGSTSCVIFFASINSQKAVIQAFSIMEFPVEPHLLPVLVKVKKILANLPATLALKPMSSMSGPAWYVDVKQ